VHPREFVDDKLFGAGSEAARAAGAVFDLLPDLAVAGAAPFEFSSHVNLERGVLRPLGDDAGRRLCDALREGGDVCALDSVSGLYRDGDGGGVCATV
jgi:hypothetical protein